VVADAGGFSASRAFSRLYMIPGGYHCLGGGAPQVTADLLDPLLRWVENRVAPGAQSFPLTRPTSTLTSITVSPMNPAAPVTVKGSGPAYNASYHWIGHLLPARQRAVVRCQRDGGVLPHSHRALGSGPFRM
jgi:feruloyl esterase